MKFTISGIATTLSIATLLCVDGRATRSPIEARRALARRDCCNETEVFDFDYPVWPEFSLEFLDYAIVVPSPFSNSDGFNSIIPSSLPRFASANPSETSVPWIQVPDNSTDTFTLKSFRIASEGERGLEAVVQGFLPALGAPPVEQNFSLGGNGRRMQFLDFSPLPGWSILNHVLIKVQKNGVDHPFVIDDFTIQKDCRK